MTDDTAHKGHAGGQCEKCGQWLYRDTIAPRPSSGGHQFMLRDDARESTICLGGIEDA